VDFDQLERKRRGWKLKKEVASEWFISLQRRKGRVLRIGKDMQNTAKKIGGFAPIKKWFHI